jgi:hypothetical protein
MIRLSVLLFLVIAVCIVAVAILIAPNQIDNTYFWITVGWLIVLSGLNWLVSTYIFIGAKDSNSQSTNFGILPSLNIIVFIYSLFSAGFLLSTWFVNDFILLPNWHLISQVVLFLIVSSLSILMFISAKAAEVPSHNFDTSKEELIKIINNAKSNYDSNSDNFIILKELSEVIKYSIPHLSQIKSNSNYNDLCKELINLENLKQDISPEYISKILKIAKNI